MVKPGSSCGTADADFRRQRRAAADSQVGLSDTASGPELEARMSGVASRLDDRARRARRAVASHQRRGTQKVDLYKWVNDQSDLDMRSKYILKELAGFAGEDCCAWAQISTLQKAANCSDRTVQYCLRKLEQKGLIRNTGRYHILAGSKRRIPFYQLAPGEDDLGGAPETGEIISPEETATLEPDGCNSDPCSGAKGLHLYNENMGENERADALSTRERSATDWLRELVDAAPQAILKRWNWAAAEEALDDLIGEGIDPRRLIDALRRMPDDPTFRSFTHPDQLHTWLINRCFLGWLSEDLDASQPGEPATTDEEASSDEECALWTRFAEQLRPRLEAGVWGPRFDRARLAEVGQALYLVAATGWARDEIRSLWGLVEAAWREVEPSGRSLQLVTRREFADRRPRAA